MSRSFGGNILSYLCIKLFYTVVLLMKAVAFYMIVLESTTVNIPAMFLVPIGRPLPFLAEDRRNLS